MTTTPWAWQVAAVADFDRDGNQEIIWRNIYDGRNYMWFLQGTSLTHTGAFTNTAGPAWRVVGADD